MFGIKPPERMVLSVEEEIHSAYAKAMVVKMPTEFDSPDTKVDTKKGDVELHQLAGRTVGRVEAPLNETFVDLIRAGKVTHVRR